MRSGTWRGQLNSSISTLQSSHTHLSEWLHSINEKLFQKQSTQNCTAAPYPHCSYVMSFFQLILHECPQGKPQTVILHLCLAQGIIFQPAGQMTKSTKCPSKILENHPNSFLNPTAALALNQPKDL